MEVWIEDGVAGGVLEDTQINRFTPDNNYGAKENVLTDTNFAYALINVDLSTFSGVEPLLARFGVNTYSSTSTGKSLKWYEVLRAWGEGNKLGTTASTGEATYNEAKKNVDAWTTPGCKGIGTDRSGTLEGSKLTAYATDFQIPLTVDSTQRGVDKGWLSMWFDIVSNDITWRSCEATIGTRPYFYMEYVINDVWHPNSYYGNRKISSVMTPQRSRRIY